MNRRAFLATLGGAAAVSTLPASVANSASMTGLEYFLDLCKRHPEMLNWSIAISVNGEFEHGRTYVETAEPKRIVEVIQATAGIPFSIMSGISWNDPYISFSDDWEPDQWNYIRPHMLKNQRLA